MDLLYPRLYLRMAIYIGATLVAFVLAGAVILTLIASFELEGYVAARDKTLAKEAASVLADGGPDALQAWLAEDPDIPTDVTIYILDQDSRDIYGRELPAEIRNFVREFVIESDNSDSPNYLPLRLSAQLIGPDGQVYAFLPIPESIGIRGSPAMIIGLVAVALLVIASVAWLIASRFGRPIDELQSAVQELTSGHIEARVPDNITNRHDELGKLAADFNLMADQLQSLIDNREQLMQEMSHELRSPLARLQASLALAALRQNLDATELGRIEREIATIDRTIGEMLRFSRLDAPVKNPRRLTRIGKLLRELVEVEEVEARARRCRLDLQAESNLQVIGNIDLLRSGFENIIRNAIRYAPENSSVDIRATLEEAEIVVRISDRGPGVPEEFLDRIFEPFFRVNQGEADTGGTGLGLAIAQRAFKGFGGTITAARRAEGGLEFTIRLPAANLA